MAFDDDLRSIDLDNSDDGSNTAFQTLHIERRLVL